MVVNIIGASIKFLLKGFREIAHIHSLKLILLANETFLVIIGNHREYMSSINRVFISEGGSSITPVF